MASFDFKNIETKWSPKYEGFSGYHGLDESGKEKMYVLQEFPYPSGSGLHVGHAFSMTGSDVFARYMRMRGKNVLFPMGWDAFGLPTENYAIKTGIKPQEATKANTEKYKNQMMSLGLSFDWEREVNTTDPSYYKWTQWIFIKLFEKGLAYKQEMPINWCPKDKIGLANEEVIDGKCERCGTQTVRRNISQWIVKITDYAERLIDGLDQTTFISKVKAAQVNWIDKRVGAKIKFGLASDENEYIEVFTTRPDTLMGATFMVISPEHPLVEKIMSSGGETEEIKKYIGEAKKKSDMERAELSKDKTGVFSGVMAINPGNGKQIPVWIADYVLMGYGTGAIMSVPSHDERDGEFAKKYNLPIDNEFVPDDKMIDLVVSKGVGEKAINYHLRDWIFSRQHYWGEPIPMVNCPSCGWVSVPLEQLPVVLPEVEHYQPTETGESPLANISEWVETKCPKCGGAAKRETDTMPNWAGSDWYFLRYLDPNNDKEISSMEKMEKWMPVDVYVGGDEHNTLHLLYSRFIYQFLWDLGVMPKNCPEPYNRRLSHGVILGPDGNRMSKSKGNVINPDVVMEKYGTDALRTYMMFMGPFDATMVWNERSLVGVKRFLDRFYSFVVENSGKWSMTDRKNEVLINKLVKEVGEDFNDFKFNTAVARFMETLNALIKNEGQISDSDLGRMVRAIAPLAPFVSEELWSDLSGDFSVHTQPWPDYDEKLIKSEKIKISVQVNGKVRGVVEVNADAGEEEVKNEALQNENVKKYFVDKEIKKVIYIEGRTISFVLA